MPALTSRPECRHGDKAAEMELVDFRRYVEAAEKLVNENPLGLKRIALVTSEDPLVIEEAARLTALDTGALAAESSPCTRAISCRCQHRRSRLGDHHAPRALHASVTSFELLAARARCFKRGWQAHHFLLRRTGVICSLQPDIAARRRQTPRRTRRGWCTRPSCSG